MLHVGHGQVWSQGMQELPADSQQQKPFPHIPMHDSVSLSAVQLVRHRGNSRSLIIQPAIWTCNAWHANGLQCLVCMHMCVCVCMCACARARVCDTLGCRRGWAPTHRPVRICRSGVAGHPFSERRGCFCRYRLWCPARLSVLGLRRSQWASSHHTCPTAAAGTPAG